MEFKDILIKERKAKGFSQEELAGMLDVSRQSISKWENGDAYPEYTKLTALAEIFSCILDYLCGRQASKKLTQEPAAVPRKKNKVLTCIVCILIALMAFGFGILLAANILYVQPQSPHLPDDISISAVQFKHIAGVVNDVHCQFVPSVVGEEYTYQIVYSGSDMDSYGTEVFDVKWENGVCISRKVLKYTHYDCVAVIVTAGDESRTIVIAEDLNINASSMSWTPVDD